MVASKPLLVDTLARFSALQRAENSSMILISGGCVKLRSFQCSSASRKFLNSAVQSAVQTALASFSALQRAENSSMHPRYRDARAVEVVSVLFSEPKIPQSRRAVWRKRRQTVSVLFSEPKIPQSELGWSSGTAAHRFSALQRAENSSIRQRQRTGKRARRFQCSSASRKFLNRAGRASRRRRARAVSVLFSEPKIPQSKPTIPKPPRV